ncbi:signal peptidase [Chryseobacterium sp. MEBOG07]|uniref:signal peptidase n=1 Tax=Chryseobacterium sp. MEBOG07 TaxID=2879939 RepID=UPI001F3BBBC8|nr:signal peptidase [Chryseobacterium sp. MEBOG07]UKB79041.1 signal peptidase [Chryseobacterium sp. MEBOG07]
MKTINKLVLALFLFVISLANAAPPPPASGGGNGGNGTGSLASPIDMYVYVLGIAAIGFIVYFTKKYKSVKA